MKDYVKGGIVEITTAPQYSHIRLLKECSKTEHYDIIEDISSQLQEMSIERVRDGFHLRGHGDNYAVQITPSQIEISCIPSLYQSILSMVEDAESIFGVPLDGFKIMQLGYKVSLLTNYKEVQSALGKLACLFTKEESGYIEKLYRKGEPALFFAAGYPNFFFRNSDKQLNMYVSQSGFLKDTNFQLLTFELCLFRRFPIRIRNKYLVDFIGNENVFRQEFTFQLYQSYIKLRKEAAVRLTTVDDSSGFYSALDAEFKKINEQYGW
ncbi:hypothetical protein [Phocaeicola sartorii]|uniref:hypothetical protein n=1 Tax=Phocaeicola sartorii TaxID=671267 RepID=UPI00351616A1